MSLVGRLWQTIRRVIGMTGGTPQPSDDSQSHVTAERGKEASGWARPPVGRAARRSGGLDPLDALLRNLTLESERVVRVELAQHAAGAQREA